MEFLENVEQSGKWPQQSCTTMFFLVPKDVTSERQIALMPTLIRLWEAMRAPEVAKCQQKYRVKWRISADSLGNFVGDGEVQIPSRGRRSRSLGFRPPPGDGLRSGQSSCGGPGRRTSASQGRSCECCAGTLSTRGECSSKDVRRNRSRPSRPPCQGPSGVVCFFVMDCQNALSEVTQMYSSLKLKVFVDDITALLMEKKQRSG